MSPSTVGRVQIKVCGITTPEEAKACVDLGADMIGINCWEPSPRYVSKEKLSAITDLIGDHVETVALFVNEDPEKVNSLMEENGFNTAQLHGDETPEYTMKINFPWFKAFRVHSDFQPSTIRRYGQSRFLLDAYAKNLQPRPNDKAVDDVELRRPIVEALRRGTVHPKRSNGRGGINGIRSCFSTR